MNKITNLFFANEAFDERNYEIIKEWVLEKREKSRQGLLCNLVNLINDSSIEDNIAWHYTKLETLEKILPPNEKLGHGKANLLFKNVNFSKDPSEALILEPFLVKNRKLFKNFHEEIDKEFGKNLLENYTFSMSYLKDSMAFWNKTYAGEDGIAIGFKIKEIKNTNWIYDVFYIDPNEANFFTINIIIELINYFYENVDKNFKEMKNFVDLYSIFFKHKSWEHEQEIRIILSRFVGKSKFMNSEDVEEGNEALKNCYKTFDQTVVDSITLGPACGEEHVEAVSEYLQKNGYGIKVERSKAFDFQRK